MKATLNIDEKILRDAKKEADRRGISVSSLVELALRSILESKPHPTRDLPPLPSFHGGDFLVDIANRSALYNAMEKEDG